MPVFQISLSVPHFSRINHSSQNRPAVPRMQAALCASSPSLVSVLNQKPPSAPNGRATKGTPPLPPSAHLPSPRPRSPTVTGHRTLSESPRVTYTLSNKSAFHPESYGCQTLNKSSRKQTKSRLLPALCPGPDLPNNREFRNTSRHYKSLSSMRSQ